jgi:hypothetical protein
MIAIVNDRTRAMAIVRTLFSWHLSPPVIRGRRGNVLAAWERMVTVA